MSKVLIATMHRGNNYGSALQTYALYNKILDLGHTPVVLDYIPERINHHKAIGRMMKQLLGFNGLRTKYNALRGLMILTSSHKCYNRFFNRELSLTRPYHNLQQIERHLPEADVYMTGSDQVWNSWHNCGLDKVFFLDFAPDDKPRVSYAASFGKEHLDKNEIALTREYLQRYAMVSVRENSAVDILSDLDLSGVEVLDPTFLYDRDGWMQRAIDARETEPYVLIYSVEPDKQSVINIARQIANRIGAKVYMCEWGRRPYPGVDKMVSLVDPLMLIDYFAKAHFVVASSFHGTALSINMHRPFVSVAPARFNTRVKSILTKVGLSDRLISPDTFDLSSALQPIDYTEIEPIITSARETSVDFLKKAIASA